MRSKKYLTDRTSRLLAFPALVAATSLVALAADEAPADKEDASAEKSVIGATAKLTLGNTGIEFPARIDTGAKTCSLHVEEWEIEDEEETMRDNIGKPIRFRVQDPHDEENQTWVQSKVVGYAIYKTSEKGERRYKVKVKLRWKDLEKEVLVNLNDRSKMEFPLLVGRNYLRGDIVVDVDVAAATQKGLIVTNTPDVLSDATAEITMLCMLGAARRATEGVALVRESGWQDWSPAFMVGSQVTGKRFGVIGLGRVGQVAARRARGFDMKVHYTKRSRLDAASETALEATYHATIEDLLPHCDVLSLHCPATPENIGLLNAERLALLPRGAIVVNTARGAVVDDAALVAALKSGHVAAAGLDVFNGEPTDIHPEYRKLTNVFALPHIGSATAETRDAMGFRALDNLDAIFAGREPRDRVA